jgi:hypothetical protein
MRRFKVDRRSDVMLKSILPARDTNAPTVARVEAREAPFRMRRYQIVSIKHGKIEKLARGLNTDGVLPDIFRTGPAITVAIKAGQWIAATAAQLSAKNIGRHKCTIAASRLNEIGFG